MGQKCIQCIIILFIAIHFTQITSVHLFSSKGNDIIMQGQHKREAQKHEEKSYDIQYNNVHDDNDDDDEIMSYSNNENSVSEKTIRNRREINDWFIAPNTHWCGKGNSANGTYNRLGGASSADICCRQHDHCQHSIPALNTRYELFNYRPYTLSYCKCDRRFRLCLKMANDDDSNTIGKIFFNIVQTQCFVLRNQKVCQERDESGYCIRHYVRQRAELKDNKTF